MSQNFLIPTILNVFLAIWYYVLMVEMNSLEKVPLFVFSTIGRSFYGMIVSFPLDKVLQTVLARLCVWIGIFLLALDIFQMVAIFNQFDAYNLTDALSILFGVVFLMADVVFIIQLYRHSTEVKIDLTEDEEEPPEPEDREPEQKDDDDSNMVEILGETYISDTPSFRLRQNRIRF